MSQIKIHFALLREDREPIDLALALTARPEAVRGAREAFEVVPLEQAEVVVYPYGAHLFPGEALAASELAQKSGLPFACLGWGDRDITVTVPHGVIYCESLTSPSRAACHRAKPGFCEDPFEELHLSPAPRPLAARPSVSFCGFVSNPLLRAAYRLSGRSRKALGLSLRASALSALEDPRLEAHFIRRTFYWAGTTSRFHHNVPGQVKPRQEFLENLLGNDYALCIRGAGNYSYRFSEALAAARIPLFVNTRCVLPFENEIDWKKQVVWVEEGDRRGLAEKLLEFHQSLTDERFRKLQEDNRRIWQTYLQKLAFYRHAFSPAVINA